ncbi:MAG TPA: glycosyltransferase [Terriglobia bacterium]|nr:glycosyltransferase [Terriglobia bacterium]
MTAQLVFWISVATLFYTYAGYHLLLKLVALFAPAEDLAVPAAEPGAPVTVSIVVAVHNEERVIGRRVENLLRLDYPRQQLDLIVASDGSTDRTNEIAGRYGAQGVRLLALGRVGKGPAQDLAVAQGEGEIVIFTDADTEFRPDFVRVVAAYFRCHPRVGALAANLRWKIESASNPPSRLRELSWKLETDLRETESRLGLLASASGAALAFRKALWKPMRLAINDSDSITPLDVILQGYSVIFAPDAAAYEVPFTSATSDFRAKVRGVSKSMVMIPQRWRPRDWARHPLIAWRTFSHHILRWAAPYAMLATALSSFLLAGNSAFYRTIVALELGIIFLATAGYVTARMKRPLPIASMLASFAVINAGFALGFLKGVVGAAQGRWETE